MRGSVTGVGKAKVKGKGKKGWGLPAAGTRDDVSAAAVAHIWQQYRYQPPFHTT